LNKIKKNEIITAPVSQDIFEANLGFDDSQIDVFVGNNKLKRIDNFFDSFIEIITLHYLDFKAVFGYFHAIYLI